MILLLLLLLLLILLSSTITTTTTTTTITTTTTTTTITATITTTTTTTTSTTRTTSSNTTTINDIITNTILLPKLSLQLLQYTTLCLLMIHNYKKYLQQLLLPIYTNTTLATTANDNNTASHTITSKTVNITLMLLFLLSLIANYQTACTKTKLILYSLPLLLKYKYYSHK